MVFDINKFRNVRTKTRTKEIPVPELKSFFDDGEEPIFVVRNLTGHELACCNDAVTSNLQIRAMVEKLMSSNAGEKASAICESLGVGSDKTPDDLVRRFNMLRFGVVNVDLTNEDAVRFASIMPELFYNITNKITTLTHLGAELGESHASGPTQG